MNPTLDPLLKEYVKDISHFHEEYHTGTIQECEMVGCRLAVDLMDGRVDPKTYQAIISGKDRLSQ